MNEAPDGLHIFLILLLLLAGVLQVLSWREIEGLRELAPKPEIVEVPVYPPLEAFNLTCYITPEDTTNGNTGKN